MNLGGEYLTEKELANAGFKKIGKNIKIHNRASIYGLENISLGDYVRIDDFTVIIAGGSLEIGSHVQLTNNCYLGAKGGIILEDFCSIGSGSKIYSASDDYSGACLTNSTIPQKFTRIGSGPVTLGKHVIVGANSVILPGCSIGEGSAIGAMSLVTRSLPAWGIFAGIPAKKIRDRKKDLLKLEEQLMAEEKLHAA